MSFLSPGEHQETHVSLDVLPSGCPGHGADLAPVPARARGAVGEATARTFRAKTLIRLNSPDLGPADARAQRVEFLDPACEGCRAFYPVVKSILAELPGKVRLTVRHEAFHRGSDQAVRVLEAARKQGKYWETLEALFATQDRWSIQHRVDPPAVLASVQSAGLDMARLQRDMESPDIKQFMEQDMADAKAVKIAQTPGFFINGRLLKPFGVDQLRKRIQGEVEAAYP